MEDRKKFQKNLVLNLKDVLISCGVQQGMTIADIGSGPNGFASFAASKIVGRSGKVYAIDVRKKSIEMVKKQVHSSGLTNIHTIWSDVEKIGSTNVPRGTFNFCIFSNILFQISNIRNALLEASSLLGSSGKVIIIDRYDGGSFSINSNNRESLKNRILNTARELSLTTVADFNASKYHFCIILQNLYHKT